MANAYSKQTRSALTLAAVSSLLLGVAAHGATLSRNSNPPSATTGQVALPTLAVETITQSTNTATVTSGSSVSCNAGQPLFLHTDNFYYRAFTLSSFNPPLDNLQFMVQNVSIGVELADGAPDGPGGTQPIEIRLYDTTTNPPTVASLGVALSTQNVVVSDQTLTVLPVAMTVQPVLLNASDILAVEVFTPNGQVTQNSFFIGSNALGQSAPSFIRAASCGITEITNLASIGFANMHIVMTVSGNNQLPVELQTFTVD
jgi:hypothetical protein